MMKRVLYELYYKIGETYSPMLCLYMQYLVISDVLKGIFNNNIT